MSMCVVPERQGRFQQTRRMRETLKDRLLYEYPPASSASGKRCERRKIEIRDRYGVCFLTCHTRCEISGSEGGGMI